MASFITPKSENYAQWYTDVVLKAELADYSPVKGCMVIRPYGFAIWENLKTTLDGYLKESGHQNAYFPLFIPYSFLRKEAEHVEGFSPEVAVVTHAGGKKLEEPLVVRPTSETIMYAMFAKWIRSYRDLPLLMNQWANVVRWEMRTRLFLRTTEFLWQEGHTAHCTYEEAEEEALRIIEIYRKFVEDDLAIPVWVGQKTKRERFAGAIHTYTIEAMMGDRKALQAGTSHNLGQNFSTAFEVKFQDRDGEWKYVWQTSWGVSTRLIGALIMVHGDDQGLRLPPRISPIQVVIIPIWQKEKKRQEIIQTLQHVKQALQNAGVRVYVDDRDYVTPGFKFNDWELRGVPCRIEIGPRDVEKNQVLLVTRFRDKIPVGIADVVEKVLEHLQAVQIRLFNDAQTFMNEHTHEPAKYEDFLARIEEEGGFYIMNWCGEESCEDRLKEEAKATIRCIPFREEVKHPTGPCLVCHNEGKFRVLVARAY